MTGTETVGTRVWLLRHAEVHADWRGVAYGDLDVPLSEAGAVHTRVLGERFGALAPVEVACSPLARARALGEAVAAAAQAPLAVAPGLRELFRGRWQGRARTALESECEGEVAAYYDDPWTFDGHGGETDRAIAARAWPELEARVRRHPGDTVVLCTHYNVIRVLLAKALGVPPAASFGLRVDPGAGALLVDGPEGWLLAHLNIEDPSAATPEGAGVLDGMGMDALGRGGRR